MTSKQRSKAKMAKKHRKAVKAKRRRRGAHATNSGSSHAERIVLPPEATRQVISDVVHAVIVDEFGLEAARTACLMYALVGSGLATALLGRLYLPQVGSFAVQARSDDDLMVGFASGGGMDLSFAGGNFHAWFACLRNDYQGELVDLTARFYRWRADEINRSSSEDCRWLGADPPECLWTWDDELSLGEGAQLRQLVVEPNMDLTSALVDAVLGDSSEPRLLAVVRTAKELALRAVRTHHRVLNQVRMGVRDPIGHVQAGCESAPWRKSND